MADEVAGHVWVNCKEEEEEESSLRREETRSKSTCEGSTSGGGVSLASNNDVALSASDAFAQEMLEMGKKKDIVVGTDDSLDASRAPRMENSEIEFCDVVEICPDPAPVGIMRANTEKGKMYRGLDGDDSEDEDKGRTTNDDAIQVISSEVVTHGPLDVIEQQGEEDIVTPTLSLLMFNIIMPCLDIYFDTLLIQKLSPDHLGCLFVIVCALTFNFSFTCLAWWRFEPEKQKTWSWIFLLLQIWPQLKAGQVE